jgi:hypothetical protein
VKTVRAWRTQCRSHDPRSNVQTEKAKQGTPVSTTGALLENGRQEGRCGPHVFRVKACRPNRGPILVNSANTNTAKSFAFSEA